VAKSVAIKPHALSTKGITASTPRGLAGTPNATPPAGVPSKGSYAFLLELNSQSTMAAYGGTASRGKAAASTAAKTQYSRIKTQQNGVVAALPRGSRVLYRTHSVLSGVAVYTDVHNYAALRRISGVQAVYPIAPKTASNSYAMPLQHAPLAWQAHGDLGANSTVAVIDTGIDYTHANFGGPGTVAAYNTAKANDAQAANPSVFPSAKVVGGTDLVGDNYNADPAATDYQPVPHPDPNPLDCGGHGSHVAGTVAGYGENADGSTYNAAYNASTPFTTMRIGPGMAPKAKLLAYKVFGCTGSTNEVSAAIDAAADPNGDGDPSDHASVINMSLGADYGSPQDGDSVEANFASSLGITVVIASGNAGDEYDAGGSPGDAVQAIAVANSVDAQDQLDGLHVSAPASIAGEYGSERSANYDWATHPDLSGSVVALSDTTNKDGCAPFSSTDAAAVHGKVAFLEWTDDDTARRCGSTARADNVAAAGGTGFIFADDAETFAAGISGDALVPGVLVTKSAGDAIRAQLAGVVTITGTSAADFRQTLTQNNDKVNAGSSRGIRRAGNVKPDVTAVGTGVFSTGMGTGNQGVSESGTSMATPMVAGLAALVRSLRPDWTPEQVKADIMNTAGQDLFTGDNHTGAKYAPNRVGAGRILADAALSNLVLAYVKDDPGAVSASFGPVAIAAPTTLTKTINVVNKGLTSATYNLSYQAITSVPGVTYQVSPTTLTVGRASTATFTVSLVVANPKLLTKTLDPTMPRDQGGLPREFLADASGRVVLTPTVGATTPLRVPVYAAPRPSSSMTQQPSLTLPAGALQKANLPLTGTGVAQGSGNTAVNSIVAGFELQASSGLAPVCSTTVTTACVHVADERSADLGYVGITSDAPQIRSFGEDPLSGNTPGLVYFAINTQGAWRTPASTQEFDIYIDSNGDNVPDAVLFNTRLPGEDVFVTELIDLDTGALLDVRPINARYGNIDTALFDSDALVMPVWVGALPGVANGHSRIRYGIASFSNESANPIDLLGISSSGALQNPLTFDALTPGLDIYGAFSPATSPILVNDQPHGSLIVRRDITTYYADHALGAMIVHFGNLVAHKVRPVTLKTAAAVSLKLSPTSIKLHQKVTATVTVANSGGVLPTGKVNIRHVGGGVFATGNLSNGKLTVSFIPGSRGKLVARAEYAGDGNYLSGNSANLTITVS
jgi:subtilisin family serine protease